MATQTILTKSNTNVNMYNGKSVPKSADIKQTVVDTVNINTNSIIAAPAAGTVTISFPAKFSRMGDYTLSTGSITIAAPTAGVPGGVTTLKVTGHAVNTITTTGLKRVGPAQATPGAGVIHVYTFTWDGTEMYFKVEVMTTV